MTDLQSLATGYLESAQFSILNKSEDCLVADRLEFGGGRDTRLVWTIPPNLHPDKYRHKLLSNIARVRSNYPDARSTVLTKSRAGFSRDLLSELSAERVTVVVPVQFFDAAFKVEEAPKTVSAIASIRQQAANEKRVPQPFRLEGDATGSRPDDLFNELLTELANPDGPRIRLVVGRAGIGKSVLFRALFGRLYQGFLESKNRQRMHPRPIPLLPEHLKGSHVTRTKNLIQNFLHDDVASPILPATFEWLLVNGFATWLFDGLDELYAGDSNFFDDLFDLVGEVNSKAQITIWCRDSILTTSDAFAEFQDVCADLDILRIFYLSEWERRNKRHFACVKLGSDPKASRDADPEEVKEFLKVIDSDETLRSISGLPFYCDQLFQQSLDGELYSVGDDVELLNTIIDKMIDREMGKGLLHQSDFERNGLAEWMEQMAVDYVEGQGYAETAQAFEIWRACPSNGLGAKKTRGCID